MIHKFKCKTFVFSPRTDDEACFPTLNFSKIKQDLSGDLAPRRKALLLQALTWVWASLLSFLLKNYCYIIKPLFDKRELEIKLLRIPVVCFPFFFFFFSTHLKDIWTFLYSFLRTFIAVFCFDCLLNSLLYYCSWTKVHPQLITWLWLYTIIFRWLLRHYCDHFNLFILANTGLWWRSSWHENVRDFIWNEVFLIITSYWYPLISHVDKAVFHRFYLVCSWILCPKCP